METTERSPTTFPPESRHAKQWELREIVASIVLASTVLAAMVLVGLIWTRGKRILGNDALAYLEYAKQFKEHFPSRFGSWWPFGFPLAGSVVSQLTGVLPHTALFMVSSLAYGIVMCGVFLALPRIARHKPTTVAFVTALACAPVCPLLLWETMSEPLFSAVLFWLAISMAFWPKPSAIAVSVVLALMAFCVRYAGIFAFGVLILYGMIQFNRLRDTKMLSLFAILFALAVMTALGLLYTNYLFYGRATGPQAVGEETILSWPFHLADFGWAPAGAFVSGAFLEAIGGIKSWVALLVGWISSLLMLHLCFQAWRRPSSQFARPLALVAAAYVLSIVTLRATTPFDAVSSGRTFLPVLFPLGLLAYQTLAARGSCAILVGACTSITLSLCLAARGISMETYGAIDGARKQLERILETDSTVGVNGPASSLAAYFSNRFLAVDTISWTPETCDYTVIASRRIGRHGQQSEFESKWLELADNAVRAKAASLLESNSEVIILRSAPRASTKRSQD